MRGFPGEVVAKMESYKLLQRLGKGSQGSVYLAVHRKSGKKYVLKKVECCDESEANKAFQEAMALKELHHPYICGYQEFFVTWDKEESAMFVCIVMEYYVKGDLGQVLREYREQKKPVDEDTIKKWLGQMVEALVFVHKRKIMHRDIKPSNIFLQEDMNICLGDFGVATIMGDVKNKTRTVVGSMNWMAPEVLDSGHDERSDIWSVGCVLLELASCSFYDAVFMSGKLNEIKHSQQALDEMLQKVEKIHSEFLVSLLKTMLQRNFRQRPTTEELVDLPYIRECLGVSGSLLSEKRQRIQSAPTKGSFPKDKGIQPVVEYLHNNLGNVDNVSQAMEYIAQLVKGEEGATIDQSSKRIILMAMKDFVQNEKIHTCGCEILNNLLVSANVDDALYSSETVASVLLGMRAQRNSVKVQQAAISLLMALSADGNASEEVGQQGGLEEVLKAMRSFPQNPQLVTTCCNALWSLAVNEHNARILSEEKGLEDVVQAMKTHKDIPELLEAASATLMSLSILDETLDKMVSLDCVGILIQALDSHMKEGKMVKNCCMALSSLVEPDEENAYKVLTNPQNGVEVAGIPIILKTYQQHRDNAEVVEAVCTLIMELSEYEEICAELKFLKVKDGLLAEVRKRFKDNMAIMDPCEATLNKLNPGKSRIGQK